MADVMHTSQTGTGRRHAYLTNRHWQTACIHDKQALADGMHTWQTGTGRRYAYVTSHSYFDVTIVYFSPVTLCSISVDISSYCIITDVVLIRISLPPFSRIPLHQLSLCSASPFFSPHVAMMSSGFLDSDKNWLVSPVPVCGLWFAQTALQWLRSHIPRHIPRETLWSCNLSAYSFTCVTGKLWGCNADRSITRTFKPGTGRRVIALTLLSKCQSRLYCQASADCHRLTYTHFQIQSGSDMLNVTPAQNKTEFKFLYNDLEH
jgi:hypothetical protein